METHKRDKNSKLKQIVKQDTQGRESRISKKKYKVLRPESKHLEEIPAVGAKNNLKSTEEKIHEKHLKKKDSSKNHPSPNVKFGIEEKKSSVHNYQPSEDHSNNNISQNQPGNPNPSQISDNSKIPSQVEKSHEKPKQKVNINPIPTNQDPHPGPQEVQNPVADLSQNPAPSQNPLSPPAPVQNENHPANLQSNPSQPTFEGNNSQKQEEPENLQIQGQSLAPVPPSVDLDTCSQKSKISKHSQKSSHSKKSVAISIMHSENPKGEGNLDKKSQGIQAKENVSTTGVEKMDKEIADNKSVAISIQNFKVMAQDMAIETEVVNKVGAEETKESKKADEQSVKELATKRTVALSVTPEKILRHVTEHEEKMKKLEIEIEQEKEETKDEGVKGFKPFVAKREQALSVITHTPTHREGPQSIALSAITHTPTEKEKDEKHSVNLSALHLSQKDEDGESEEKSYRSVALSGIQTYGPKNYIPPSKVRDVAVDQSQKYQTDKSIPAIEKEIKEIAIGKSGYEGVADLHRDDKSIAPKSIYQDTKSIGAKSYYQSEKSINPKTIHRSEKSLDPKTINQSEKSIDPKSLKRSEKSIGPITDNKVNKSVHPRSYLESREESKYPRHRSNFCLLSIGKSRKYDYTHKHKHRAKSRPRKVDHQCQVVHGRDKSESNSSHILRRNKANHPYLRDQYTNAYKQDTGNQYRMNSRSDYRSHSGSTVHMKRFQVDEDLTIQLNVKGGKSDSTSSVSTKMDKQIQVRHGQHVEIKQHRPKNFKRRRY